MHREAKPSCEFGPFRLDVSERRLLRHGEPVPLTPKVFDVLCVLVENAGHLVEKENLLKEVWPDSFVEEGALNRSVSVLRKALGDSPSGRTYIETVPKRGYRFVAPVTALQPLQPELPAVDSGASYADSHLVAQIPPAPARTRSSARVAAIGGAVLLAGAALYIAVRPLDRRTNPPTARALHRQITFTGKEGTPTISPDGRRIAYVSIEKPEKKLIVQELAGGQPHIVFTAPEIGYVRWSPDGAELIVWARGSEKDGVYVISQFGGLPRLIARDQYIACWSPDGSVIAIGTYLGGKIWIRDKRGRHLRTLDLQGVEGSIRDLDWSADGRVMFVSDDGQARHTISTIRADGTDQATVIREETEVPVARFAPGGESIYYFRRANQTVSLNKVLARPDQRPGGPMVTSVLTGLETDRVFGLSADATRLVYARAPYYSNLWLVEPRGAGRGQSPEPRQLTRGTWRIERPRVSPDGSSIVANIGYEPMTELHLFPLAGGASRQLTYFDAFSVGGVWSADGKSIAFASTRGGKPRVWIISFAGGNPRPFSSGDMSDGLYLTWSSRSRILYQQKGNQNLYELDPETREERLLIPGRPQGWVFSPEYSPGGAKVAVNWSRPTNRGIWVLDPGNQRETLVYKTSVLSTTPIGWSSDGRSIYVVEGRPSTFRDLALPAGETLTEARILVVPVDGGEVKTVALVPFEEIGTVAMTPDGRQFVVTVYSWRSDVWIVDDFDASIPPRSRLR